MCDHTLSGDKTSVSNCKPMWPCHHCVSLERIANNNIIDIVCHYINDLLEHNSICNPIYLCAKCLCELRSVDASEKLQTDINNACMQLEYYICSSSLLGQRHNRSSGIIILFNINTVYQMLNAEAIRILEQYIFTSDFNWITHYKSICAKANIYDINLSVLSGECGAQI